MRNHPRVDTWASYIKAARENVGMSRPELAKRAGVGRTTAYRWEEEGQVPENLQVVERVAEALGLDTEEALQAAGLQPSAEPPTRPATQEPPPDPQITLLRELLNDPKISPQVKESIRSSLNALVELARARDAEPAERREAAG